MTLSDEHFSEMEGSKSGIASSVVYIILLAVIGARQTVLGAPVPPSVTPTFYDKLYQNRSEQTCPLLPKVGQLDSNFTRSMINQLCDSTMEENVVSGGNPASLCNSLEDLFPKICKSYNSSVIYTTRNTTVDLKKLDALGIDSVCSSLIENIANISQQEKEVKSPFTPVAGSTTPKKVQENSCSSMCKNLDKIREDVNEYSKLTVHPACQLLLESYKVYNMELNAVKKRVESKDVVPSDVVWYPDPGTVIETKPTSNGVPAVAALQKANTQEPTKLDGEAIKTTPAVKKETTSEVAGTPEKSASQSTKSQDDSSSSAKEIKPNPETVQKETTKASNLPSSTHAIKQNLEENQVVNGGKASSTTSTTTTTTTVASVDVSNGEAMPVVNNENKLKSSTAIPRGNDDSVFAEVNKKQPIDLDEKTPSVDEKESDTQITSDKGKQSPKPNKPGKGNEESGNVLPPSDLAELDGADYNAGEDLDNDIISMRKPSKISDDDKEVEIPQPETQNMGYDLDSSIRPSKNRVSGNEFREEFDFSRDTTINVSLKESEDTGFFSYFLFCVTLVGVMYLIVHNKKKLIAYVMEGKRPRSRSRRSSSSGSGQYRRLENNYD